MSAFPISVSKVWEATSVELNTMDSGVHGCTLIFSSLVANWPVYPVADLATFMVTDMDPTVPSSGA